MTAGTVQKGPPAWQGLTWLGLMLLVVLFGLSTIFAAMVTAAEAFQEHAQARWPEVTARVDKCGLTRTSTGRRQRFYIRCRLSYAVGDEQQSANLYSRTVPSPEIWQYPPNQIAPFEDWVNRHPPGTPISVRYDPADHTKMVLAAANPPLGGPRTPSNVNLLEFVAGTFLVLAAIARITRPQSLLQSERSSMPPTS